MFYKEKSLVGLTPNTDIMWFLMCNPKKLKMSTLETIKTGKSEAFYRPEKEGGNLIVPLNISTLAEVFIGLQNCFTI